MSDFEQPSSGLNEEATEPLVVLYDFLYKDNERIASYYAQLFQGRTISTETTTANREGTDRVGKGNAWAISGELKFVKEKVETLKEIQDPHDKATVEVLSYFADYDFLYHDIESAPHGGLVLVRGQVHMIDGSLLKIMSKMAEKMVEAETLKPIEEQNIEQILNLQVVLEVLPFIDLPSALVCNEEGGNVVCGTLKNSGTQEPVIHYNIKHGVGGLNGVYLLGIKEETFTEEVGEVSNMLGLTRVMADALTQLMFPPNSYRMTPLALFRVLSACEYMAHDQQNNQAPEEIDVIGLVDQYDKYN
jgi:hypothetical protein